ncbi:MFS transporter [Actinokineospora sp. HUAS TT18]|uniref:MFS transporter n=1 Tax=Actinokineospora sp. HUAS TT18 TaxID=3447451 RepID=UPI003F5256AC
MTSRIIPAPGPARTLAFAQLTNSVGDGAFYVTSALFFTRVVGLSPAQIGLGLTLGWAVGFLAGVPLGHAADRLGARRVAIGLAVATAVAISAFLFVRTFPLFIAAAIVYAVCQCGLTAARQALLAGSVDPATRTEVRAHLQSTLNAGLAVGAALGGLALQLDTTAAYLAVFAIDALAFLGCALILRGAPAIAGVPAVKGEPRLAVLRDRPYAVVTLLNTVLQLHIPLINLAIPLWIVTRTAAPTWMVSTLLVINTTSVVLFQVRLARRVTSLPSAARSIRHGGTILLASCLAFALTAAGGPPWIACAILLAAAALQALGEMLHSAGAYAVSFDLAPADKHGQYQGFFGSGFAVARMVGPLLLTTMILTWGLLGWLILGALFLGAALAMGPAVRWAARTRPATTEAPVLVGAR